MPSTEYLPRNLAKKPNVDTAHATAGKCRGVPKCAEGPAKVAARKAIQEQAGNKPYAFRLEPSAGMACSSLSAARTQSVPLGWCGL